MYIDTLEDSLAHEGVGHEDGGNSGRYPWGSGENPYQRSTTFMNRYNRMLSDGMSKKDIAKAMGYTNRDGEGSVSELDRFVKAHRDEIKLDQAYRALEMRKKGMSNVAIAKELGLASESSVRAIMDPKYIENREISRATATALEKRIDKTGWMLDVGTGAAASLGCSQKELDAALAIMETAGYPVYKGRQPQVTNKNNKTTISVVCPPGTKYREMFDQQESIHTAKELNIKSNDGGKTYHEKRVLPPTSLDSKRLKIVYAEDGGIDKDGLIEIRRGLDDLNLNGSVYSQVRIMVDGTHYLKGMAVYSDNLPDGIDVQFNTNKHRGTPMMSDDKNNTVLKLCKKDANGNVDAKDPFGATIKPLEDGGQFFYKGKDGKEHLSPINKREDEGGWEGWSNTLASQFLSKQPEELIKRQLRLSIDDKQIEFNDIKNIQNPTIKKNLLASFALDCDNAAVELKAAALPRQKYQVLIPMTTLKDNEVYAPNFNDGEKVALIRYPHGGIFEIPICTVNNKNKEGINVLTKTPRDAIGISAATASQLSGADFDGDTALVIPTNSRVKIQTRDINTFAGGALVGFDPKSAYPEREGMRYMTNTQTEMGKISNLITDMTLKGANEDEIARAVKHSMCIIDAEKHALDYKRSERENNIDELKRKYQFKEIDPETGKMRYGGASTLISRAKGEISVDRRQGSPRINPKTGELEYKTATDLYYAEKKKVPVKDPEHPRRNLRDANGNVVYETRINKDGKEVPVWVETGKIKSRTQQSTQMAEAKDARELSSGHLKEELYAQYANAMKAMANEARKEMMATGNLTYSASAHRAYAREVANLEAQLEVAKNNKPLEREANRLANDRVKAMVDANKITSKDEIAKLNQKELMRARSEVGARRQVISISDREWEAIQAGAISDSKLKQILNYTDIDKLRERATPRNNKSIPEAKQAKIMSMYNSGTYTRQEIADALGVSTSTISKVISGAI